MRNQPFTALALAAALLGSSCATWEPVRSGEGWTLYSLSGQAVDGDGLGRTLEAALAAVERELGPFRKPVRVHAWDGESRVRGVSGGIAPRGDAGELEEVPGIGPARVRAFHVRGGNALFSPGGIFLGAADVGTAVHELVHARLAEEREVVPLWFEEGLASFYGDGADVAGRWVTDGLACWPLRELRSQRIGDEELRALLELKPSDRYDARQNLLVHFVGWAIVFDLAAEAPGAGWKAWIATFRRGAAERGTLAEARRRIARTLEPRTEERWLERLGHPDPGVRLAAAKGLWKLRSSAAVEALVGALERESEPQVRAGMALNALLCSGEMRLSRSLRRRLRATVYPSLREVRLPDEREQEAALELYAAIRWSSRRGDGSRGALEALSRYWEE